MIWGNAYICVLYFHRYFEGTTASDAWEQNSQGELNVDGVLGTLEQTKGTIFFDDNLYQGGNEFALLYWCLY